MHFTYGFNLLVFVHSDCIFVNLGLILNVLMQLSPDQHVVFLIVSLNKPSIIIPLILYLLRFYV
jgi:hypothetical protein